MMMGLTTPYRVQSFAILDIGTSNIVCLVGKIEPSGAIEVHGVGHHSSKGMKKGAIVNISEAEQAIIAAIDAAESDAGERIEALYVTVPGTSLTSSEISVSMTLDTMSVDVEHVRALIAAGIEKVQTAEQDVIHYMPVEFILDGQSGIQHPVSMHGKELSLRLHVITAHALHLVNIRECLAYCQLDVHRFIAAPYASALACLTADEKQIGCMLLDIGGGTTDYTIFHENAVVGTGSVPIGGHYITSDIAHGLNLSYQEAERIKTLHGSLLFHSQTDDLIELPRMASLPGAEPLQVSRSFLTDIIRSRMEELCELIQGDWEKRQVDHSFNNAIVITGGGAQLLGVKEFISHAFNKTVRVASPHSIKGLELSSDQAGFSTAIGAICFLVQDHQAQDSVLKKPKEYWFSPLLEWFRRYF